MMAEQTRAIEVFYCYAHKDQALRDELEKHLAPLKRLGQITGWYDYQIQAGTERGREIALHLSTAGIFLLLVSPDFISSDYCYSREMQQALKRHKAGEACVIPIIVRDVEWEITPIGKLQALPRSRRPITSWRNRDEAFREVAQGIREVVATLQTRILQTEGTDEGKSYTINTHEAIELFRHFMQAGSQIRVMRLMGDGNTGKSHLLTKVFPDLAVREHQARCATLDLRHSLHTAPDILHEVCRKLDTEMFSDYYAAQQELADRPKADVESTLSRFSSLAVSQGTPYEVHYQDNYLTTTFVNDLRKLADRPLLLLFDSVNDATEGTQKWLMNTLLVQLSLLDHVRIVVAGRSLPEAHGSYTAHCQSYQLQPVTAIEEYLAYCQNFNTTLSERDIRTLAQAFDYLPGSFVGILPKFMSQGISNG